MNFPPQGRPRLLSTPFVRAPPMRFRSAHTKLPNRVAYMTTRENSSSDHLCQIVPVKRPTRKVGRLHFDNGPDSHRSWHHSRVVAKSLGTRFQAKAPERGTPRGSVFAKAPAKRTGSHICRPVKKASTPHPVPRAHGRIVSPVVQEAIDSALVLTIADP